MTSSPLRVKEGQWFSPPQGKADRLRTELDRLKSTFKRASFNFYSEKHGTFQVWNVIGTLDLGNGILIEISPKLDVEQDWLSPVISLLTGIETIDVAGDRNAGYSPLHNRLLEGLAGIYIKRLEQAFRRDGPIFLMERLETEAPSLRGKLDVTRWSRTALWRPHVFPVTRTVLAHDNPFTQGLVGVGTLLRKRTSNPGIRRRLDAILRDLSVGNLMGDRIPPGLDQRRLPVTSSPLLYQGW